MSTKEEQEAALHSNEEDLLPLANDHVGKCFKDGVLVVFANSFNSKDRNKGLTSKSFCIP